MADTPDKNPIKQALQKQLAHEVDKLEKYGIPAKLFSNSETQKESL
jgi:hypothetical protein